MRTPGYRASGPHGSRTANRTGLAHLLHEEFEPAPIPLADVLTFCDMTTSPDGEPVPVGPAPG